MGRNEKGCHGMQQGRIGRVKPRPTQRDSGSNSNYSDSHSHSQRRKNGAEHWGGGRVHSIFIGGGVGYCLAAVSLTPGVIVNTPGGRLWAAVSLVCNYGYFRYFRRLLPGRGSPATQPTAVKKGQARLLIYIYVQGMRQYMIPGSFVVHIMKPPYTWRKK